MATSKFGLESSKVRCVFARALIHLHVQRYFVVYLHVH